MAEPKFTTPNQEKIVDPSATTACGGDVSGDKGEPVAVMEKPAEPEMDVLDQLAESAAEAPVDDGFGGLGGEDLMAGIAGLASDSDLALLEQPDFSVETDDYSNIDEPHWLFDTQLLFDKLKCLASIVKDRQELVAKSIILTPGRGYVSFRVNTGEGKVEIKVDLLNTTQSLDKSFIFCKDSRSNVRNTIATTERCRK